MANVGMNIQETHLNKVKRLHSYAGVSSDNMPEKMFKICSVTIY